MKKVIIMLAAALISVSAMAQVRFGVKVGADLTNFWGEGFDHSMKPAYQIGALMEYKFNDKFAIAPEAVFAAQGGKHVKEDDVDRDELTFNLNYINVPVMLKYYVTPDFAIDLGPQVGFNVYSKYTNNSIGKIDNDKGKTTHDLKETTKAVDFGVGLGGTYSLTENAFLQARYTLGLTKVFDYSESKNGNIQVAFGWKF